MAKITSAQKFKSLVKHKLIESKNVERRRELLALTFLGFSDRTKFVPEVEESEWIKVLTNLDRIMEIYARIFLYQSHLYNATKHGLAVNVGDAAIEMSDENDGVFMRSQGSSVAYLHSSGQGKNKQWQITTAFVDPEQAIVLSYIACQLIQSLWSVGRAGYLGEEKFNPQITLLKFLDIDHLFKPGGDHLNDIVVRDFSIPLDL